MTMATIPIQDDVFLEDTICGIKRYVAGKVQYRWSYVAVDGVNSLGRRRLQIESMRMR